MVADIFDGNVFDEPAEYLLGHVRDEVVNVEGVATVGDEASPTVVLVEAKSRLISMSP